MSLISDKISQRWLNVGLIIFVIAVATLFYLSKGLFKSDDSNYSILGRLEDISGNDIVIRGLLYKNNEPEMGVNGEYQEDSFVINLSGDLLIERSTFEIPVMTGDEPFDPGKLTQNVSNVGASDLINDFNNTKRTIGIEAQVKKSMLGKWSALEVKYRFPSN